MKTIQITRVQIAGFSDLKSDFLGSGNLVIWKMGC